MSDTIQKSDFDLKKFEQISTIEYILEPPESFVEGVIRTFTIPHGLDFQPTVIGLASWFYIGFPLDPTLVSYKEMPLHSNVTESGGDYFDFARVLYSEVDENNIYLNIGLEVNLTTSDDPNVDETIYTKFFLYREQTI